jgi:hypothetical protein
LVSSATPVEAWLASCSSFTTTPVEARLVPCRNPATPVEARLVLCLYLRHTSRSPVGTLFVSSSHR